MFLAFFPPSYQSSLPPQKYVSPTSETELLLAVAPGQWVIWPEVMFQSFHFYHNLRISLIARVGDQQISRAVMVNFFNVASRGSKKPVTSTYITSLSF